MAASPVLCLVGPTGTGKSEAAMALSRHFPIEVISVDSAAVYRHMDIGTAKPSKEARLHCPHHLIDMVDPDDVYSAGAFFEDSAQLVRTIRENGKIPLLVGGTMMYAYCLLQGLSPLPPKDPAARAFWLDEGEKKGWATLHRILQDIDPLAAGKISLNDKQRISRFLEIYTITGKPWSALCQEKKKWPFPVCFLGWDIADRQHHEDLLKKRFAHMLEKGLVQEASMLVNRYGLTGDAPSMKAVGYREAWLFLQGKIKKEALLKEGLKSTLFLVKRQRTWMRKLPLAYTMNALKKDFFSQVIQFINQENASKNF